MELRNSEILEEDGKGEFQFYINQEPVFLLGTNWVPADVFHSRDRERIPDILRLVVEEGCNAIRCWGGNVYEDDLLYDLCDEYGLMVWQDFTMACGTYPQDDRLQSLIRKEATAVVKRLR
ncbi:MAG: glycoside hydrolase family 2, partial [Clostridia bacterium]